VSAEGIESARERKFNNMQGHGWHKSARKAMVARLTDRGWIATVFVTEARRRINRLMVNRSQQFPGPYLCSNTVTVGGLEVKR